MIGTRRQWLLLALAQSAISVAETAMREAQETRPDDRVLHPKINEVYAVIDALLDVGMAHWRDSDLVREHRARLLREVAHSTIPCDDGAVDATDFNPGESEAQSRYV